MDRDTLVIWVSLLIWVGGISLFLVMMRSLLARYTRLFHSRMRTSLETAEFVIRTGQAPPAWQQLLLPTDPWRNHLLAPWYRFTSEEMDLQLLCQSRMDDLIRFFESSPVVQGTETRSLLLAELRARREHWQQHGVSIAPESKAEDSLPMPMIEKDSSV